jgi:FkbM family methyltransferase
MFHKALSAFRLAASPVTWGFAVQQWRRPIATSAARDHYKSPFVQVGESDAATGLVAINVGGVQTWQPLGVDVNMLASIHREVFDESHPHHYEHGNGRIDPGTTVFDVGACEGFFTRFALDKGASFVVAVEPWSLQAAALRRTFAAEIKDGRVRIACLALGDSEGKMELRINPAQPWGAALSSAFGATVGERVRVATLDVLVEEIGRGCDFLKADVEGSEVDLLDGARCTLDRFRPRLALAAYHRPTDYLDMRRRVLASQHRYVVVGKGILRRLGLPYPVLMHAW